MASIHIGTSGWTYATWRDGLYRGVPRRAWLAHAATTFGALEINGSFYTQIRESTYARWYDETPSGFRFALKGHRFVTHYKRLLDVDDSIELQRAPTLALREKLAAVVWQLPARQRCDLARLAGFVRALRRWPEVRHVFEPRDISWFTDDVADILSRDGVGICISDAPDFPMWYRVTSGIAYVRLHGHSRKYASSYRRDNLARWADALRGWAADGCEVHCYLDNDAEGAAVANALTLRELVNGVRGPRLAPSRRMARSTKDEEEERARNKSLQGDHTPGPQRVGHGVSPDEQGRPGAKPDDAEGGRQQGSRRGS